MWITGIFLLTEEHDPNTNSGNLNGAKFCEGISVDSHVYTLKACGGSGNYVYSIVGDLSYYFTLRDYPSTGGEVVLDAPLDYESASGVSYYFTLVYTQSRLV